MSWLPFERYELRSALTAEQIAQKIVQVDEESDYAVVSNKGKISIKEPNVIRLGAYTNSFKPEADILIKEEPLGTAFTVTIRPPVRALAFLFFAVCFIVAVVIFSKRDGYPLGHYKDVAIAIICVLSISYLLPVVAFNAELSKLKSFINDFFEAEN